MMDETKIKNHIKHLEEQHDKLDSTIFMLKDTSVDDLEIKKLKKAKLYIKDQITKFKKMLNLE
jgi:hypothetical protein